MFLINWIDKNLDELKEEFVTKKYFKGIGMEGLEGTNYLFDAEKGLDIVFSEIFVARTIHLFSQKENINEYQGEIPFDLNFSMSQQIIRAKLGALGKHGGGHRDLFGAVPLWDKYFFDKYSLHFQYSKNKLKVEIITIASLSLEPYFNIGLQ